MRKRTLLVVDGDNLRLGARDWNEHIAWTRFLRYLRREFDADTREVFMSYQFEDQLEYWSRVCRNARYYFSPYKVTRDKLGNLSGYPDELLKELLHEKRREYDRFVLVSSDMDFDWILLQLQIIGKETVLVSDSRNESASRLANIANRRVDLAELLPHFSQVRSEPQSPQTAAS
jgi:hypothetical protein